MCVVIGSIKFRVDNKIYAIACKHVHTDRIRNCIARNIEVFVDLRTILKYPDICPVATAKVAVIEIPRYSDKAIMIGNPPSDGPTESFELRMTTKGIYLWKIENSPRPGIIPHKTRKACQLRIGSCIKSGIDPVFPAVLSLYSGEFGRGIGNFVGIDAYRPVPQAIEINRKVLTKGSGRNCIANINKGCCNRIAGIKSCKRIYYSN